MMENMQKIILTKMKTAWMEMGLEISIRLLEEI